MVYQKVPTSQSPQVSLAPPTPQPSTQQPFPVWPLNLVCLLVIGVFAAYIRGLQIILPFISSPPPPPPALSAPPYAVPPYSATSQRARMK